MPILCDKPGCARPIGIARMREDGSFRKICFQCDLEERKEKFLKSLKEAMNLINQERNERR